MCGGSCGGERQVQKGLRSHALSPPFFNSWRTSNLWAIVTLSDMSGMPADTRLSDLRLFQCWDGAGKLGGGYFVLGHLPLSRPVSGEKNVPLPPSL